MNVPGHTPDWRSRLKNFFLFCSGAELKVLIFREECHIEHNRYVGIGASVLFTALFAFATFSYAMHMIFGNIWTAMLIGLLWGAFIFNLDRLIINSSRSSMLIRIPVAVLLALSITVPFELKIFEKEIDHELKLLGQEILQEQEAAIRDRYAYQITENQEKIDGYKSEIAEKQTRYDALIASANLEGDGTGGSGNRGLGPVYEAKKKTADAAFADLESTRTNLQPQIDSLTAYKQTLISERDHTIQEERSTFSYDGFVPRLKAFHLIRNEEEVFWASILITLLFLAVELAPILVKMMFKEGSYEVLKEQFLLETVGPVQMANHSTKLHNAYQHRTLSEAYRYQTEADDKGRSTKMEIYSMAQKGLLNKIRAGMSTSWWSSLFPKRQEQLLLQSANAAEQVLGKAPDRLFLRDLQYQIPVHDLEFEEAAATVEEPPSFFEAPTPSSSTAATEAVDERARLLFSNEQELFSAKGQWLEQMDEAQSLEFQQRTGRMDQVRLNTEGPAQINWRLYGEGEVILTDRRLLLYQPQSSEQKYRQIRLSEIEQVRLSATDGIVVE
ncbi:MAG: DUF4407 domain-containing protein, partial [Phaeodactylibacter sp.]|nr:DUF4407 domain-containing protein [Phaeodactylibacter sp.]